MVAFQSTIHDSGIALFCDAFLCSLVVNPVRETPHIGTNSAKLDGSGGMVANCLFEMVVELAVVEEYVRVMVPSVEVTFHRLQRLNHTVQFLVSGQNNEGSIGARLAGIRFQTAGDKHLVVLFANFSTEEIAD